MELGLLDNNQAETTVAIRGLPEQRWITAEGEMVQGTFARLLWQQ